MNDSIGWLCIISCIILIMGVFIYDLIIEKRDLLKIELEADDVIKNIEKEGYLTEVRELEFSVFLDSTKFRGSYDIKAPKEKVKKGEEVYLYIQLGKYSFIKKGIYNE